MAFACVNSIPPAIAEGRSGYLQRIAMFIVLFVSVHYLGVWASKFNKVLASRQTVLGGTLHGVGTSWLAMIVVSGVIELSWWPFLGLPFSMAYLLTDVVFYCWPKKDVMIFVHHCVMILAHFTTGTMVGASVCGAGKPQWAQWISVVGYLSEMPNPFLNTRWLMTQTLKENTMFFSINNGVLLFTWIFGRLVCLPSNLFLIIPRFAAFEAEGGYDCFAILVMGHVAIVLMSVDWLAKMLRGGLKDFFVFNPKSKAFNPNVVAKKQDSKSEALLKANPADATAASML